MAGAVADGLFTVDRLYLNLCDPSTHPPCNRPEPRFAEGPALTAALVAAIDEGRLLVNYVGHGAPPLWAGAPTIFTVEDVGQLRNGDRLPITLDMTCYTGAFHFPQMTTLAEALLRAPAGGAIASWASSGQGVARGHDLLDRAFLAVLLQQGTNQVGLAAVAAKAALWVEGGGAHVENLDTFHLFGDPALRVALPEAAPPAQPTATSPPPAATSEPPIETAEPPRPLATPIPAVQTPGIPNRVFLPIVSTGVCPGGSCQ